MPIFFVFQLCIGGEGVSIYYGLHRYKDFTEKTLKTIAQTEKNETQKVDPQVPNFAKEGKKSQFKS